MDVGFQKLQSKGKSSTSVPAQPPVTKSVTPATEWHLTPEPVAQPPPVSYVPESTTQVPQESFASEEGEYNYLTMFLFVFYMFHI